MNKSKRIGVRVTEEDHNALKEKAKQSGISMSEYLTAVALEKEIIVIQGLDEFVSEIRKLSYELHKMGNNFNQLTKMANMGKITFVGGRDMEKALSECWEVLFKLSKSVKTLKKQKKS